MTIKRKYCKCCSSTLNIRHFSKDKSTKDGYKFYCKRCDKRKSAGYYQRNKDTHLQRCKDWAKENPEKCRAIGKRYRDRNPEKMLELYVRKYGLSVTDYFELLGEQKGVCRICGCQETAVDRWNKKPKRLSIDHCHSTNTVRGLLCDKCNKGLGCFKDNKHLLQVAISYLGGI